MIADGGNIDCIASRCKLCGTENPPTYDLSPSPRAAQAFGDLPESEIATSLQLYQCQNCGLVYLNAQPVSYYRSVVRSTHLSKPLTELRALLASDLSKELLESSGETKSVFEVGAHRGENLAIFKRSGFTAFGCEYISGSTELLKEIDHAQVWDISLDQEELEAPLNGKIFDCVVSFNFLEHFVNPLLCLKNIFKILRSGGIGYIEVPDFDSISRSGNALEFIPDHLSYFTKRSLQFGLAAAGFEIIETRSLWDNYILGCRFRKPDLVLWENFQRNRSSLEAELAHLREDVKCRNEECFIWGAGHQSLFMLVHFGVASIFAGIIDSSPAKIGKYASGLTLPIFGPNELASRGPVCVLVCAGGFNSEIIESLKHYPNVASVYEVSDGRIKRVRS